MKSWLIKLISIGILAAVFLKYAPAIPLSSVVTQKQDVFTVSGEGKVTVVPDMGIVDLGVTTNNSQVKAAQNQANTTIGKISDAIKTLGVSDKDIKTANYNIYPQYDYTAGGQGKITGYQVNINLTVKVRDIDKINAVVDAATNNGANTVGGIQLTINEDRQKQLLQEARDLAVTEAKTKANSLAKSAGLTLGKIINVQESGTPVDPIYSGVMDRAMGGGGGETKIQAGSTDIVSSIVLTYETR